MAEKAKTINEVFGDYKSENNIKKSEINGLNLLKKKNVLEIKIKSNEYIEIKDIWDFEKFLMTRFKFNNIELIVKYSENVIKKKNQ